jgi:hypothetical protein
MLHRATPFIRPLFQRRVPVGNPSFFRGIANHASGPINEHETVSIPASLRKLRNKEKTTRRLVYGGLILSTVALYYLDGNYNARAFRRTIRTAFVGALLAADYKWNFTYVLTI